MATNIEVKTKQNENWTSLLRRFSRKARNSQIVQRAKSSGQHKRELSDFQKKQSKLKRIERTKEYERLYKLGKIKPRGRGRRRK